MMSFNLKQILFFAVVLGSVSSFAWTYESEQCDSDKLHSVYQGNMVHGQELLSRKDSDDGIHGIEIEMQDHYTQAELQNADYFYSIVDEVPTAKVDESTSECFTIRLMKYKHTMVVKKVKPEITAFLGLQEGDVIDFTCKMRESVHLPNCHLTVKPPVTAK